MRECTSTRAHPRRRLMRITEYGVRTSENTFVDAQWYGAWLVLVEPQHSPSGTRRGNAELAGVWGQGLGIPWPLLGCPCRLRRRFHIQESTCRGFGAPCIWRSVYGCVWKMFTHALLVAVEIWTLFPRAPCIRLALFERFAWFVTASVWVLLDVLPTFST